jgi:hypothetical protein
MYLSSSMASGIYNLESSRFNAAPRDTRKEGWTEAWGADEKDLPDDAITRYQLDNESIASSLLATPHPQLPLLLTQFRPAWMEQMALRMAKVPHIVVNSNHVTNEATGPLPYLRDRKDDISSSSQNQPPILVGRNHPSNIATPNPVARNHILQYLQEERKIDLDEPLVTPQQKAMSKCFLSLVQSELEPIVLYLRYEDHDAWEQVYRQQYLQASTRSPQSQNSWVAHLHGRFQACLERATSRRRLVEFTRTVTIPRALERAREAYAALELQLQRHAGDSSDGGSLFLMGVGGNQPTLVDAVLWAHLAEALCDVHLVVVLADFPNLVKYFQNIHKQYFESSSGETWDEWNQLQNKSNAFQQLPLQNDKKKLSASTFKDAIDLMQSLSLRDHDLQDVLETTKAKRSTEPWPTPTPPTETILYRWRMGEDLNQKTPDDSQQEQQDNPMRKKLMRDQMRNDQMWISGVVGVSAIAIILLQGSSSGGEK